MKQQNISKESFPPLRELMNDLMSEEELKKILPSLKVEDIPGIDLYMDQVTTFMESRLGSSRRNETDKVLTKTMINNYAKNDLLPPPQKKKYSKEHLILMIFIYYFKGFLSMQDIRFLLQPLSQAFFGSEDGPDIATVYETIFGAGLENLSCVSGDIETLTRRALDSFTDVPDEDRRQLQYFAMICFLSMDITIKKRIVEKMIDAGASLREDPAKNK